MPDLRYERFPEGNYAIFTMDRPDRLNAQGLTMRQELRDALDEFAADPEMRGGHTHRRRAGIFCRSRFERDVCQYQQNGGFV